MYVIDFSTTPCSFIPEEDLRMHQHWLINPSEQSRMPITEDAIKFHNLALITENSSVDITWTNDRIYEIFAYKLIPGVCEVPNDQILDSVSVDIPVSVPEPVVVPELTPVPVTEPITAPAPVVVPEPISTPVVVPEPVTAPALVVVPEPVVVPEYQKPFVPETPKKKPEYIEAVKDIYNNDHIKEKFSNIYECIGKINQNRDLLRDVISDFESMQAKGIKIGAALPDLYLQMEDLSKFEKTAIEEINKISTLNKMLNDQITSLENKCNMKAGEISGI